MTNNSYKDEILPVGSIVQLSDGLKYMIIGYLPNKIEDFEFYDYLCCLQQKGIFEKLNDDKRNIDYFYVNKEDIDMVLFLGYKDESFEILKKVHKKVKDKLIAESKKSNKSINDIVRSVYMSVFLDFKQNK